MKYPHRNNQDTGKANEKAPLAAFLAEMATLLPQKRLIVADERRLRRYSRDQVDEPEYWQMPQAVLFPITTAEVAEIMRRANHYRVSITPRGGGTGLSGGAIAEADGVVLSFRRMNRILEIDQENQVAVVEAGVVTADLNRALQTHNLFFPGYPLSEEICLVGGNVAENAGGARALKYGVTGNHLLGAEVVTPEGEVMQLGGKRLKDVTGYNLLGLLVGSEGTLTLFTKLFLRISRRPDRRLTMLTALPDVQAAMQIIVALRGTLPHLPATVEFIDGLTMRWTMEFLKQPPPDERWHAFLLIEYDQFSDAGQVRDELLEILKQFDGMLLQEAAEEESQQAIWRIRSAVPWMIKRYCGRWHSLEDVVTPISMLPRLMEYIAELRRRYNISIAVFGHGADGNFHLAPMKPKEMPEEHWKPLIRELLENLYRVIVGWGGTISGEHGIGTKRRDMISLALSPAEIALMRRIKRAFDPRGILNPNTLIPSETGTPDQAAPEHQDHRSVPSE